MYSRIKYLRLCSGEVGVTTAETGYIPSARTATSYAVQNWQTTNWFPC